MKEELTELQAKLASKEVKKKEHDETNAILKRKTFSSKSKAQKIWEDHEQAKKRKTFAQQTSQKWNSSWKFTKHEIAKWM